MTHMLPFQKFLCGISFASVVKFKLSQKAASDLKPGFFAEAQ